MGYKNTTKPTKEDLQRLYVDDGLTSRDIAKLYDCSFRTVLRCIHKFGIAPKPQGEARREDLEDKDWIQKEYQTKPLNQIAEETGASTYTIRRILKMFDIPTNPVGTQKGYKFSDEVRENMSKAKKGKRKGGLNPNWKGGYTPSRERNRYASKKWSSDVKARDNNTCQKCHATDATDAVMHSHHIKPWKKHPELRYDISNGITLCVQCHQKEHGFPFPSWIYNQGKKPTSAEHPQG